MNYSGLESQCVVATDHHRFISAALSCGWDCSSPETVADEKLALEGHLDYSMQLPPLLLSYKELEESEKGTVGPHLNHSALPRYSHSSLEIHSKT